MRRGHKINDRISLELNRRIAADLPHRPDWLDLARRNLLRWKERNKDAPGLIRCYDEWLALLDLPVDEICAILTAETDESQRLRINSPFAGALSPQEVWAIKRHHWAQRTAGPAPATPAAGPAPPPRV